MDNPVLTHLKGSTWYLPGATNIGIYDTGDGVYLIDSGNDKEAGRKLGKVIASKDWRILGIINTHSNADHIGANDYLQRQTQCRIFATQAEKAFIESPRIEASFLWGGFPLQDLNNKFFEAKASTVTDIIPDSGDLPDTLRAISLPGHFFGMIGVMTADDVCFLGDCMFGSRVLEKYKIPFVYDVDGYKKTIETVKTLKADYYVLSHGDLETDIRETADLNLELVGRIEQAILRIVEEKKTFDGILRELCDGFGIILECAQYALVGCTLKSFLSYLNKLDRISYKFESNIMYWKRA